MLSTRHLVWQPFCDVPTGRSAGRNINFAWQVHLESTSAAVASMPKPLIFNELCNLCRSIFSDPRASPGSRAKTDFPYHSLRQLIDTANGGCHFCSTIVGNMDDVKVSKFRHRDRLQSGHRNEHALTLHIEPAIRNTPCLWVRLLCEVIQGHEIILDPTRTDLLRSSATLILTSSDEVIRSSVFARSTFRHLLSAKNLLGKSNFPSTMNEDTLNSTRKWISYCEKAHPGCTRKLKSAASKLPGRLLDMRIQIREGKAVRLVKTENLPSTTRYMTLSHRWSEHNPTQLLGRNEARFHAYISFAQLSKTFTDAMELTRALGIDYLWIDSLCIIQDSEKDKIEQIMLMGEIYANSVLNIAAVSASEGTEGLDHRRNPLAIFPYTAWKSAGDEGIICYNDNAWQEFVGTSVLNSRGWVIQERLLAPRTVSFAVDQVYWECRSLRASESFPFGLPLEGSDPDWDGKNMKELLEPRKKDQIGAEVDVQQFMENWLLILRVYTSSNLTYESDRLKALSGVTDRLAMNFGIGKNSDYIAGFWRFGLEYQLLWSPSSEDGALEDSKSVPLFSWTANGVLKLSNAPSWSWVSQKGPFSFTSFTSDHLSLVSIHGLGCDDADCDNFCLRIQGYICDVPSISTDTVAVMKTPSARSSGDRTHLLYERDQVSQLAEWNGPQLEYILLLQRHKNLARRTSGIDCLILELTGRKHGQYRRIGVAHIGQERNDSLFTYDYSNTNDLEANVSAADLTRLVESIELPEACFESFEEGKGYIIEII